MLNSRFAIPHSDIKVPRSRFERNHNHKTTMSAGLLYPLYWDEVLPGDTFQCDMNMLVRMSTPVHPVMDDCFFDYYWFFVPNRQIWDHWKEFMGESPIDPYINPIEYTVPQMVPPNNEDGLPITDFTRVIPAKSLLDYLGVPALTQPRNFSVLSTRAYVKIWNEWFRDQNLQNAANLPTGDNNMVYSTRHEYLPGQFQNEYWNENSETALVNGLEAYVTNAIHGGDLCPVNKYHDYFTSALLEPQKGDPVAIPLNGIAPVYAMSDLDLTSLGISQGETRFAASNLSEQTLSYNVATDILGGSGAPADFTTLAADLRYNKAGSEQLGLAYSTINDLRYAAQLQSLLVNDARFGTRYREIVHGHFGVTSPDVEQQVPEYLGGKRVPINMSQVLQTSSTDETSPQGNTAAYSLTVDKASSFTKSFTEHGILMCVGCIRTKHTYQQGLNKMFSRLNRYDFYFPELDNIPDQPIYNREIYNASLTSDGSFPEYDPALESGIFGYQEAYAEYKYYPDVVSAEMRSLYPQSLDVWHYADDYASQPYLSSQWIRETRNNIDRTLAVDSDVSDQFICDFYFKSYATRAMSLYSSGLGRYF